MASAMKYRTGVAFALAISVSVAASANDWLAIPVDADDWLAIPVAYSDDKATDDKATDHATHTRLENKIDSLAELVAGAIDSNLPQVEEPDEVLLRPSIPSSANTPQSRTRWRLFRRR